MPKKLIFVFFSILLVTCESPKTLYEKPLNGKNTIVYIFPNNVNTLLKKRLQARTEGVFICLYSFTDYYEVIINEFMKSGNFYANNTNRAVYINRKFYPLIFNLDMIFGTPIDANEVLKEKASEENTLIKRSYLINEGYFIKFKTDGTIISSGNGLSQKDK